jgi:hypothetical protein
LSKTQIKKLKKLASAKKLLIAESDDCDLLVLSALKSRSGTKEKKESKSGKYQRVREWSTESGASSGGSSVVELVDSVLANIEETTPSAVVEQKPTPVVESKKPIHEVEAKPSPEKKAVNSEWEKTETYKPRDIATSPRRIESTASISSLLHHGSRNTSSQSLASMSSVSTESALNHTIIVLMQSLASLQKTAKSDAGKIRGMVCQIGLLQEGIYAGNCRVKMLEAELAARDLERDVAVYEEEEVEDVDNEAELFDSYYSEGEGNGSEMGDVEDSEKDIDAVDIGVELAKLQEMGELQQQDSGVKLI